jgi:transposase InsO family protein
LTFWRQGWILDPVMFILYFVRLPLCIKYSDYIVTFISIHSVIIYVVFFGACMRCTRLCSLKPGVTIMSDNGSEFKNLQVEEFLEEEGIKHEFSAPYTP